VQAENALDALVLKRRHQQIGALGHVSPVRLAIHICPTTIDLRIHHTLIYINAEPLPHEYQAVIWRISPTTICRGDRHFDARSRGFGG